MVSLSIKRIYLLISFSTVAMYLRMPVYAGFHRHESLLGDELVKLRFPGLIPWDVYEANQRILRHGAVVHVQSENKLYLLKGVLRCSICENILRTSAPTSGSGKHSPRYHCKCKGHGSLGIESAHEIFCNLLDAITPTEATVKLFKEVVKRTAKQQHSSLNQSLAELQNKREHLSSRIDKVYDDYLDGNTTLEEKNFHAQRFENERNTLDDEIAELKSAQRLSEATINYVCNFLSMPAKLWKDASLEGRRLSRGLSFQMDSALTSVTASVERRS